MQRQQTIAEKVSCTGLGLHSGAPVQLTLHPARANTGIVFACTSGSDLVEIPARSGAVLSTANATTLGSQGARVGTVEHLLASLYALRIQNVRIEVDGPEIPVMDGSAASFVYLVRTAGIFTQREPVATLRIKRAIEVSDGERRIRVDPARVFGVSYAVDFDHPAIGRQELSLPRLDDEVFERELARARTFGFLREVSALWKAGLARGGSLKNTLVLDSKRVLNGGGLRWKDEFVRHKMLDLLGDLALLGVPIQGHVTVERGGHALHHRLVRAILARRDYWRLVGSDALLPDGLDWVSSAPVADV